MSPHYGNRYSLSLSEVVPPKDGVDKSYYCVLVHPTNW